MRSHVAFLCVALAAAGCRKGTGGGTGGGGGGGGWLVGSSGLMVNIDPKGQASTYELGATDQLDGIACRYQGEAWVVGEKATLLYTNDGGQTWSAQAVPVTGDLRAVATQDAGPVFLAGNGAFLVSTDTGASWTQLGDATTQFRAVAAAQEGATVLALSDDGGLWSYGNGALVRHATLAGARAIAVSPDGTTAIVAGRGLLLSRDSGATWTQLALDPALVLDDVRIGEGGSAVAVGAAGAIATIDPSGAVSVQHVGTAGLHALHIADPDSIDAIGYAAGDDGEVLITHDAGATWAFGPNVGRTVLGVDEIGFGHR